MKYNLTLQRLIERIVVLFLRRRARKRKRIIVWYLLLVCLIHLPCGQTPGVGSDARGQTFVFSIGG